MFSGKLSWATAALALAAAGRVLASPTVRSQGPIPATVSVLHEFDFPSWCENLAIRSNGEILTSRLDAPAVYQVDHTTGDAVLVTSWDASTWMGALGISEVEPDVFYVNVAAFTNQSNFVKTSGVNSIFRIDMNTFALAADGTVASNATVTKLTDIPEADFLNGLTTLSSTHLLTTDVYSGVVYAVDVTTGEYYVAVENALTKFTYVADPPTNLGANGLKVFDGHLYWTNTAAGLVAKVPINAATGKATGAASVVATGLPKADDFIIRSDGTLFVAANQQDTLFVVYPGTSVGVPLAGSNTTTTLAGVTAGKFGRTSSDSGRLYLSTSGALALPINGTVVVSGTISYIDASLY
ncbi:hypothetical protein BX600DRAFT_468673 [Xylariales sp. PMI_506]|nr:hypothetical protein BX600DRAFT_468673 [Xylariales sp. PMI_506]